jgi:extracellular elastinolytic metalloproteinase
MKNIFAVTLLLFSISLFSQVQSRFDIASRYMEQNTQKMGLTHDDIQEYQVTHARTEDDGITYIYLNQTVDGLPVKNAMLNFTIDRSGKVVFVGNSFIKNVRNKVTSKAAYAQADRALIAAAHHLGKKINESLSIKANRQGIITFDKISICDNEISAQLVYDVIDDKLVKTWEFNMDMADNADYWELRINASDLVFSSKNNYTVFCSHAHGKYAPGQNDCIEDHYVAAKLNTISHKEATQLSASYKVFALPGESPSHTTHSLVVDPHFIESSPFGWHDIDGKEGAEFTITRGNNVYAYTDKNDDQSPDTNVTNADGGAALNFNFPIDFNKEPTEANQASQTNLFYVNNMIHDITAIHGFTEEAGNFQVLNYSGKGKGTDHVRAHTFDGFSLATPKLDNANFSTPSDGISGTMQMFLFNKPTTAVSITAPESLLGLITTYGDAQFGKGIPTAAQKAIEGSIVVAKDNVASEPTLGCGKFVTNVKGKVALVDRGECNFSQKVKNAETAGAIAVIICNVAGVNGGNGEEVFRMSAGAISPDSIPSILVRKSECDKIRVRITNGEDVKVKFQKPANAGPSYLDGALDNGIILHEYAHGISNRLTGGPAVSSCLNNGEQMGEGWSDYFALALTTKVGDIGSTPRGIGTFVEGQRTDGRGIRRFPYTTDMAVNPQTYKDIKGNYNPTDNTPEEHAIGEIWTDVLWDLHWKFIEKYGFNPDWKVKNSGNAKALQLVIQGMKLQRCSPGFISGRDAILSADTVLNNGVNGNMIWDVFARRGMGYYAKEGNTNNIEDGVENFETNPFSIELLKVKKNEVQLIKPNEEIRVILTTVNHVPTTQAGVTIVDQVPAGFTYVNNSATVPASIISGKINLQLGQVPFKKEDTISYKIKAPNIGSTSIKKYGFEGFEAEWEVDAIKGTTIFEQIDIDKKSGETSFFIFEDNLEIDQVLISPIFKVSGAMPTMRFWHKFETASGINGGFLEVSTDGGTTWSLVNEGFIKNGYNSIIPYSTKAIPSLKGFTGSTESKFIDSYLNLAPWKDKNIQVRFRFVTNGTNTSNKAIKGWFIDDVELLDIKVFETQACIANDKNEKGSCSEIRKFILDVNDATPVEEINKIEGIKLNPNLVNQGYTWLEINAEEAQGLKVSIVNLDGKILFSNNILTTKGKHVERLDVDKLASGMYIVLIEKGESKKALKFVKI